MSVSIHEQIGEDTVRQMDQVAIQLVVALEAMPAFAAGRNAAGRVFADRAVPEDLAEAASIIRQEATTTPFSGHIDRPEFVLASVMAAFAISRREV